MNQHDPNDDPFAALSTDFDSKMLTLPTEYGSGAVDLTSKNNTNSNLDNDKQHTIAAPKSPPRSPKKAPTSPKKERDDDEQEERALSPSPIEDADNGDDDHENDVPKEKAD